MQIICTLHTHTTATLTTTVRHSINIKQNKTQSAIHNSNSNSCNSNSNSNSSNINTLATDYLPSLVLVCPSNSGSATFTLTTAVSPSRMYSPGILKSLILPVWWCSTE